MYWVLSLSPRLGFDNNLAVGWSGIVSFNQRPGHPYCKHYRKAVSYHVLNAIQDLQVAIRNAPLTISLTMGAWRIFFIKVGDKEHHSAASLLSSLDSVILPFISHVLAFIYRKWVYVPGR